MSLTSLVPNFLKPVLRPAYNAYLKVANPQRSRNELHKYWKQPYDGVNLPSEYLEGEARSQFLVELIKKYAKADAKIFEIGCNVGRNLNHLFQANFVNLSAVEISENALKV